MAEIYNMETDETLADVACGEDHYGVWVSGVARPAAMSSGLESGAYPDPTVITLRNFRLPDPPLEHVGRPLTDFRFSTLADLAITYLSDRVIQPAVADFG